MTSFLKYFLSILTVLLFGILFPTPSQALENYQEGPVIFSDNFNDGNFDGWIIEAGTWFIDGANQLAGYKFGTMQTGRINSGDNWDDYRVELDVRNDAGVDEGIGFRRANGNNFYELNLRHNPGDRIYNTPEVALNKSTDGVLSQLADTHSIPLVNSQTYHVKIEAVEEHIQVWIDSTLVFDLNDPGTKNKAGFISLSYWSGDYGTSLVRFDNIKVTSLKKLRLPVVFIPGIGGSELKTNSDTYWIEKDDGHGGKYTHLYPKDEKIWVNQDEATKLGDDDYFDILKLKPDGITSEADIGINGWLTPYGYGDIESFFTSLGYVKDKDFFIYNYDWRKDIAGTRDDLDKLIETAKQKSGAPQVNIVAHSMGGLVARNYIADSTKTTKVNKLIELGVPHLGTPNSLKSLLFGSELKSKILGFFPIGLEASETKDIFSTLTSIYELVPSLNYYSLYNNSDQNHIYPYKDERDIDNNKETGSLDYSHLKTLLSNLNLSSSITNIAEQFHNFLDPKLSQPGNVKLYEIVGTGQPTLGQIRETWWINWPVKLIPKTEEIFINGDDTVPLYSASLKSDTDDLSAGARIYYVEQRHNDLVNKLGAAMQTVKMILNEGDIIPENVSNEKINLEGSQISLDDGDLDLYDDLGNHTGINQNGEVETNIPCTYYDTSNSSKTVFIKNCAPKTTTQVKSDKNTNVKVSTYTGDQITKNDLYKNVTAKNTPIKITTNQGKTTDVSQGGQLVPPTTTVTDQNVWDLTPPITNYNLEGTKDSSGNYFDSVKITLSGIDNQSGILKTQYSLDNGQSLIYYSNPFNLNSPGTYTLQFNSLDKAGNEEIPQTLTIKIISSSVPSSASPTPTPTPAPSSSSLSYNPSPTPSASAIVTTAIVKTSSTPIPSPYVVPSLLLATNTQTKNEEHQLPNLDSEVLGEKINVDPSPVIRKPSIQQPNIDQSQVFKYVVIPLILTIILSAALFQLYKIHVQEKDKLGAEKINEVFSS